MQAVSLLAHLQQFVPPFLRAIARELEKQKKWNDADKVLELELSPEEWDRIERFMILLRVSAYSEMSRQALNRSFRYPTMPNKYVLPIATQRCIMPSRLFIIL